jgi:hypothetical protein
MEEELGFLAIIVFEDVISETYELTEAPSSMPLDPGVDSGVGLAECFYNTPYLEPENITSECFQKLCK